MKKTLLLFLAALVAAAVPAFAQESLPQGAQIESLSLLPAEIVLDSPHAYNQVIVSAQLAGGDRVDVTRIAQLAIAGDCATVSEHGRVDPTGNGSAELVVTLGDKSVRAKIAISGFGEKFVPDYVHDVMPVMSRLGCNQGTCHGSKDGKNGFKLSLRGYDPIYDLRAFTDDLASRRVNLAAPDSSLMLLKATGAVPHEGGQLTRVGSKYYQVLREWIANGAQLDLETPRVTGIEVFPQNPVVQRIGSLQQMRVIASYADGEKRDVTAEAFVESGNTDIAKPVAGAVALVEVLRRGEAPILVRFEGAYAATTVTAMGDRSGFVWEQPPANNRIDELVADKLKRMKTLPSGLCDDYEFVRRIYLDLTGLPPTPEQVSAFIDDGRDSRWKRDRLIDTLIGNPDFVDHWANKWADLLQVNGKFLGREGATGLRNWIRAEVEANTPYDEFARKVLTASGSNKDNPPAAYFKILREPAEAMENTTHLFLATRFNCNKCHDHPFERWTQDNYYELSAFFAQVGLKRDEASGKRNIGGTAVEGAKPLFEIVYDKPEGEMTHERTGSTAAPEFPFETAMPELAEDASRREQLAAWITSPDNRYFASSYANRIWGYLTGTGIIEPLDDIRAGNPPSNPELLAWLTEHFVDSGFDTRELIRTICKSRTYQLSIESNEWNEDDEINFSHSKARRLPAEVLFDTIYASTGARVGIPGVPAGTRAAALPDVGIELADGFLGNLGRPVRESACECERSSDLQLGPVMALISGPTVGNAISDRSNAIAKLVSDQPDDRKLVEGLFMRLLSRPPSEKEIAVSVQMIAELDVEDAQLADSLEQYLAGREQELATAEAQRAAEIAAARDAVAQRQQEVAPLMAEREKQKAARTAELEAELKAYEARAGERQAAWEAGVGEGSWVVLEPVRMEAQKGTLTRESDGSIFASGENGKGTYTIVAETGLRGITGVRIEALPDDRLPKNGPGRASSGNFVLSEFEVHQQPQAGGEMRKVVLQRAVASFSQKGFEVEKAIDGKAPPTDNGWAIADQMGKAQMAIFETKGDIGADGGTVLTLVLNQQYSDAMHSLGRFRISVTTSPRPLNLGLPEPLEKILGVAADQRDQQQRDALAKYFRDNDSELKRRQAELAESKKPIPPDAELKTRSERLASLTALPPVDPRHAALRRDVELSKQQLAEKRLTAAQDIAWALINTPAFLFNH